MKYALRRQEIAMCSPEYVTEHILKSLNSYFGKQDNKRIIDDISQEKYVSPYGGYYSLLRINDLADYKVICWQPIPSFDEILEANRDVLERIKEKGD